MNKNLPLGLLMVVVMVLISMIAMVIYLFMVASTGLNQSFWFIPTVCLLPMLLLAFASFAYKFSQLIGRVFSKRS